VAALLLSVFLKPWKSDEGWIAYNAYRYQETGQLLDVIDGFELTFRSLWVRFLALEFRLISWPEYWMLRVPSWVAGVAGCLLWHQTARLLRLAQPGYVCGLLVLVWFFVSEAGNNAAGISVREESVYGLGMLVALFLWARLRSVNGPSFKDAVLLHAGTWAAAVGFAMHPNGIIPWFFVNCLSVGSRRVFKTRAGWTTVGLSMLASGLFVVWSSRLPELGFAQFWLHLKAGTGAQHPFYMEPLRYASFVAYTPLLAMAYLGSLLAVIDEVVRRRALPSEVGVAAAVTAAWLTFLPAKWPVYLVLWLPHAMLGAAAKADRWSMPRAAGSDGVRGVGGAIGVVLICGIASDLVMQLPKSVLFQGQFLKTRWVAELENVKAISAGSVLGGSIVFFPFCPNLKTDVTAPDYWVRFYSDAHPAGYDYVDTVRGMNGSYYTVWRRSKQTEK
jgi:hypothetical protein